VEKSTLMTAKHIILRQLDYAMLSALVEGCLEETACQHDGFDQQGRCVGSSYDTGLVGRMLFRFASEFLATHKPPVSTTSMFNGTKYDPVMNCFDPLIRSILQVSYANGIFRKGAHLYSLYAPSVQMRL
jgi:hypothetical protein